MNTWLLLAAVAQFPSGGAARFDAPMAVQDAPSQQGGGGGGGRSGGGQAGGRAQERAVPYADAIKDYKKSDGVVTVFQKEDSVLFQIPKSLIGRDFLWTVELKGSPTGLFSGSSGGRGVVQFEQRGERLLMKSVDYSVRATEGAEIQLGVAQSNMAPIIKSFSLRSTAPDGSPVIEVGSYFRGDIPEFSMRGSLGGTQVDQERSFINGVKVFPQNVNVEVTQTVTGGGAAPAQGRGGGRRGGFGGAPNRSANTGVLLHSIVLLPEKPMMPRMWDSRVGYFNNDFTDYGTDHHGVKEYAYISRYRLEKKDPQAAVSEPKKQIVYYVSREVPAKWRKYIKQGIEDWQPAFEAAGFKNAIVAKDAPSEKEDPDWDPEDARYSVIRWAPLPIANAVGPHTSDPRSGEILSAHVIVWHDILKLQTNWFFAQAAATEPRAQKLPMPDDLMGECLRFVVSHEVGHTLGLPHNGKSSAMIPVRLLRDAKWTAENGTCTSIMDYARFNYVAQPGDHAALMPKIGRYDTFAIKWGYTPIEGVAKPEDEKRLLDAWASAQVADPMLRFYDNFSPSDPTAQSEALGDNAVEASTYGVANLKKIVGFLLPAATKFGEDYTELQEAHGALVGQFMRYIGHVNAVIGGVVQTDYHSGRGGMVYQPCPAAYQRSAVQWLCDNVLDPPSWLVPQDVMFRIGNENGSGVLSNLQGVALRGMLADSRIGRMLQNEASNGANAYTVEQMMDQVRSSVFREANTRTPVSLVRRNVQREFVNALTAKLASSSEVRIHAMAELEADLNLVRKAAATPDRVTAAHYDELRRQIEFAMANPDKMAVPATTPANFPNLTFPEDWCGFSQPVDWSEWWR